MGFWKTRPSFLTFMNINLRPYLGNIFLIELYVQCVLVTKKLALLEKKQMTSIFYLCVIINTNFFNVRR